MIYLILKLNRKNSELLCKTQNYFAPQKRKKISGEDAYQGPKNTKSL